MCNTNANNPTYQHVEQACTHRSTVNQCKSIAGSVLALTFCEWSTKRLLCVNSRNCQHLTVDARMQMHLTHGQTIQPSNVFV